jgi:hypothetical protein
MVEEKVKISPSEISRVAVKAPSFWERDPELWFLQVESQFINAGITTDTTKFHIVVASLDSVVLSVVKDIVKKPPANDTYIALKDRILKHYSQSETTRLNLVLKDLQLGDKRPSHLLVEMRNLAENKLTDEVLKSLWLQRLPTRVQQILSVCTTELSELAQVADKVLEVSDCSAAIASVSNDNTIDNLKKDIVYLKQVVAKLSQSRDRSRPRRDYRGVRSRDSSRSSNKTSDLCWYHRTFAQRATKCRKPCTWSGN